MLCKVCNSDLPETCFQNSGNYNSSGAIRYKSICTPCGNHEKKKVKKLRKQHPKQTDLCACCGRETKLLLDHCHESGLFRGYICTRCNTGIALLGGCEGGVERALNYLRSH